MQPALYFPKDMMDDPWERWTRWLSHQGDEGRRCFHDSQKDDQMFLVAMWEAEGVVPSHYLNDGFTNLVSLTPNAWSLFVDDPKPKPPKLHKALPHTLALIKQMRRQGMLQVGLMFWVQAGVKFTPPKAWVLATE